ncbi:MULTISPECIES: ABC transporter permease [Paenibacillus]|uniref:ABC transporter permease subunit n=1 Tax=Paenibacillus campinasensis TaxID=66347 RepID=A0A268EV12_9BACL|nr:MULTISPECIES: iron ABC transporter permease [Paenibacillus]MUG67621.1 ABC transporter permease subunit [Paenibacillus campinasensis]PAD76956.1 iron ABC transporter permease [Paenibacillus campinasensis]PAK55991.1 iron ABC transporter permease [Paenibacillus sp. 7541]
MLARPNPAGAPTVKQRLLLTRWDFWTFVTFCVYIFMLAFIVYPLVSLFFNSFVSKDGGFTLQNYLNFFKVKYYHQALLNSFLVSSLATVLAILIGTPLAYIATRYDIKFKGLMRLMVIMSLLSPPFIGAYSWILLMGNNGFITKFIRELGIQIPSIYGWHGIVIVFALQFYPHIFLYVSGALKTIDTSLEEASESLGMTAWRRLRTVTLPLIFPTLSAGALMVFMASFADFGTPMLLGQGYKVLPILAYEQFVSEMGGNPAMASTLSVIMIFFSTIILFSQRYFVSRKNYSMTGMRTPVVKKLKPMPKVLLTVLVFIPASISILPQLTVLVTSFLAKSGPVFHRGFSLDSYKEIFFRVPKAILNTYSYSVLSIIIMVIAGMLIAYLLVRRKNKLTAFIDGIVMIPYIMPGTVLGISLIIAFNKPPIVLTGTWVILVIAYVVRKIPYTIRSSTAVLHQLDRSVEEASVSLGVPPMKTFFKTTGRLMAPGVMSGAILSWITTINELSSTLVLYYGATATISVTIYSEVFTSNYGTGAALASILTLTTLVSLLIANKLSGSRGLSL